MAMESNHTVNFSLHNNMTVVIHNNMDDAKLTGCLLYSFIVNTILIGLLCVMGLIGNLVAFSVFWLDNIKTSTTFLFQALSLIDSILLIMVFPLYVIEPIIVYYKVSIGFEQVQPYIIVYLLPWAYTGQSATIWVTVLVGFNRFIAVCKPYQAARLCNIAMAKKYLLAVLVLNLIYNIPRFIQSKLNYIVEEVDGVNQTVRVEPTYTEFGNSKMYHIIYGNICYLIFLLILPLLTLTILNVRLINALREIKRRRMEMQSLRQQQDNNVTFVLIIVVLVFSVCQLPALVNQMLWNFLDDEHRGCGGFQFYFSRLSNMLVITNSAINFLIYFLFNTRFRQVFMEQVWCMKYKPTVVKNGRNGHAKSETTQTLL